MSNRLPDLFTPSNQSPEQTKILKKQGGIFQLNLSSYKQPQITHGSRIQQRIMNATFTSGFRSKNNSLHDHRNSKTAVGLRQDSLQKLTKQKLFRSINPNLNNKQTYLNKHKAMENDQQQLLKSLMMYRTLQLGVNRYQIPKHQRLLSSKLNTFRSAKSKSFSLQKNPQTCLSFHQSSQSENVISIFDDQRNNLAQLQLKITPYRFTIPEYKASLKLIKQKVLFQLNNVQTQISQKIIEVRHKMSQLRKQTHRQTKKNKFQIEKYAQQQKMYIEMIEELVKKGNQLGQQI